ncbi:MAG TPA: 2-C-methyl-D-erythritol 4-phosphate cytidylyltransferase [Rhodothermia bacterium]|nr:2-C-methyl-D-erythritol 4-phosphate cytidylyltransferase [Rhodothermia bacterium]
MKRPEHPGAAVIIPAAGAGLRLGGTKKQFRLIGGKPLLVQTALLFERHTQIDAIVIAAARNEVDDVARMCRDHGVSKVVSVVPGGEMRQESVRAGLASLDSSIEIVLTHDAVRPFVSAVEIDLLLSTLADHRAAVLAAPVTDTLCRAAGECVSERVDRDGIFRLLTPQAFRRDVLELGHELAAREQKIYTDEVTLVKAIGADVALVPCSSPNLKITTPADWEQAVWMWPAWEARGTINDKR